MDRWRRCIKRDVDERLGCPKEFRLATLPWNLLDLGNTVWMCFLLGAQVQLRDEFCFPGYRMDSGGAKMRSNS
eukprot:5986712-Pyramimonas_sp.AAC.1